MVAEYDDLRYRRCKLMRDLVNNPLYRDVEAQIRLDISNEFLATSGGDGPVRESLYLEGKALDRVIGRILALANEATAIDTVVVNRRVTNG